MSIDPVSAAAVLGSAASSGASGAAGITAGNAMGVAPGSAGDASRAQGVAPADFARWMSEQIDDVNRQIGIAERSLVQLAAGEANLHQVMLDLEKARLAFQLTVQVRNKLVEGYQELMRMQI